MEPIDERFQERSEISQSGPIWMAECDCHGCEGESSLDTEMCRHCVLKGLAGEDEVERVILKRKNRHVFPTSDISKLAKTLAALRTNVQDRSSFNPEDEERVCSSCIDRRMEKMENLWPGLWENPHDLSALRGLKEDEELTGKKCEKCTNENFFALIEGIESALNSVSNYDNLENSNYDEVFDVRILPFFVEGVWNPPEKSVELMDSYSLRDDRGMVRIYEQEGRPVPFYELDLPEFDLPDEELELLDEAYRMELKSAPSHARFARPSHMRGFAEDWYNTLLHLMKERSDLEVSSEELRKLAKRMADWLNYRILEPLSRDENITDIYIEAPPELQPIRVVHQKWGNCETGIYWSSPSLMGLAETLASKLGRSFDEPNPQLDAEIPELGLRLFISRHPVLWTENSAAAAIRKRRSRPWTQPLFMDRGSITPLASSFVSNLIRLGSSLFTIGDIGTAKTSYLITQIPEIGSEERIIAFQDTEELQFEDFVNQGYELENVRVMDPEHLQNQVNAFLRGGAAYWLITEVRSMDAVKSALGAAARRGSQPVLSSFHARTKRQMFDLVCNIMELHEAAYKYVDFIVSTAKFETPEGTIRRVTEISEILKGWEGEPEYAQLFADNREEDILEPVNLLKGPQKWIQSANSYDLRDLKIDEAADRIDFLSPEEGGSRQVPRQCDRLALDEKDFLKKILSEAKMKSELLMLARNEKDESYLELPFVRKSYDKYFSEVDRHAPDYERALSNWRNWLGDVS